MQVVASYCSDVGIRKEINQDSLCLRVVEEKGFSITMAVVCDGMGGLQKGEIASASVIHAFTSWFDKSLPKLIKQGLTFGKVKEQWKRLIVSCNQQLVLYGQQHGEKLGTTVTAVFMADNHGMFVLHVGDCRLYEIKNEIVQLTEDQTLVQLQVNKGLITKKQAKNDPRQNIILQCIGDTESLKEETYLFPVKRDCTYILCSDGFRHKVSDAEIKKKLSPMELSSEEKLKINAKCLVELCKQRKEHDNISVIVIRTL